MPEIIDDEDRKRDFAARLRGALNAKDWSAAEMARRVSAAGDTCGRYSITNYLNAKALPRTGRLRVMAHVLNMQPDDLLPDTPSASDFPAFSMQESGKGQVWLRVNQRLPYAQAMQVLAILGRTE